MTSERAEVREPQAPDSRREVGQTSGTPAPHWDRLSFTGDPEDEASVASALAEPATGDPSLKPWMDGDPVRRTVAVGPGIAALRANRSPEEMALTREVARRVVAYREAHRLPQRVLAEHLQMPQSTLARIELGLQAPTLEPLTHLARTLGLTFTVEITPDGVRLQPAT